MPTDIFPEINIPVVSVVWTYNGMSATDMQNRILSLHERQLASLVDDISRIEANSYDGVGVIKVYLHEGADVSRAISQLASSALVVLKYMPRNITPPLILRYGATDVPIIQLSLSSNTLTDTALNDLGQNIIRPALAVVRGASVPYPYGGKPRVIMVGLDQEALQARGLTPADMSRGAGAPERHHAFGRREDGHQRLHRHHEQQPGPSSRRSTIFPLKRDRRQDGLRPRRGACPRRLSDSDQFGNANGRPGTLMSVRKTGGVSTLAVVDGVKDILPEIKKADAAGRVDIKAIFDQSVFVKASLKQCPNGRNDGGGANRDDDPTFPRKLEVDADHIGDDFALDHHRGTCDVRDGPDAEYDDARRICARSRDSATTVRS